MAELNPNDFEAVIGLEIHIQLNTNSKAFCSDSTEYGVEPNTLISEISLAYPGTLPKHNTQVVENAIKLGLALNCDIRRENHYARKNYFYADLPKGYQITQDLTPICNNGYVTIKPKGEDSLKVNLTRIHMEEDAGKSLHDQDINNTLVDYNRAGVALLEIVTEPEIKNSNQAYAFISEVRKIVRYLDICDGNMEEGSMRCDANVSIMPKGSKTFGTKVEVKNMNSMSNVKRAIEFEINRQFEEINAGHDIFSETRSFKAANGSTVSLRAKEEANDYRYFPEPDLPPLFIDDDWISAVKEKMPILPDERIKTYKNKYGLSEYDANVLTENKDISDYFESVIQLNKNYKSVANWVMGHIKAYLNDNAIDIERFSLKPQKLAQIIELIDDGKISNTTAVQKIFPYLIENDISAEEAALKLNVLQSDDLDFLTELINNAFAKFPNKVEEYKNGKTALLGLFVGEVMKNAKGKADPRKTNDLIRKMLSI